MSGTAGQIIARSKNGGNVRAPGCRYGGGRWAFRRVVESELFGHVKGAFSGAVENRLGKFEMASGGTLFLDEIGELPLSVQATSLRVLQGGDVKRVGSDRSHVVDIRLLAASLIAQRLKTDIDFRVKVFWQVTLGCFCTFLVSPLFFDWPTEIMAFSRRLSLSAAMSILFMSIVGGAIVFYIWLYLIKHQSAEYASYATLCSPIIFVVSAMTYFGETPPASTIIGFAFILTSALIVNILRPAWVSRTSPETP